MHHNVVFISLQSQLDYGSSILVGPKTYSAIPASVAGLQHRTSICEYIQHSLFGALYITPSPRLKIQKSHYDSLFARLTFSVS